MADTKQDKKDSEEIDLISGKTSSMPQKEMKHAKVVHHKKHKKMMLKIRHKLLAPKPKHKEHHKSPLAKKSKPVKRVSHKDFPTLNLVKDADIAMDFAAKAYERFNKLVKSVVLFGSTAKQTAVQGSDIDIIIIIDDVAINWDQELISWYREELDKIIRRNPYKKSLHINTIKLSTWWDDLLRGDPMIINVIRYGESMIDFGGFFEPLKFLLLKGKIRSTPEAVYACLQRAPQHFLRSKTSELGAIEGLYWAMVDASHAALISRNILPPSPEHIPLNLKDTFVAEKSLDMKFVIWYRDLLFLYKKISHGEISDLKGVEIDMWQERTNGFMKEMARLVDESITGNKINFDLGQQPEEEEREEKKE
ncbi:MAG: nucleotidyltransferase domain-containing protein [Candidatus Nanoarchaeia archaeon]|nr:nucleotidyltransferase domain-containing protein [Candidatus Nanoarchaeia archaeon]